MGVSYLALFLFNEHPVPFIAHLLKSNSRAEDERDDMHLYVKDLLDRFNVG